MTEFGVVIKEILDAANVPLGSLAGITDIYNDMSLNFKADQFPFINIDAFGDTPLASRKSGYRVYTTRAHIFICVQYDSKTGSYPTQKALAEGYMDTVQSLLLANPLLVSTSYPNGFSCQDEKTKFGDILCGSDVISGVSCIVSRAMFETEVLKRSGAVALL